MRELVNIAFACIALPCEPYIAVDSKLLRPAEVDTLVGDASKARAKFGWRPTVSFQEMIHLMVEQDLKRLSYVAGARR